MSVGEESEGPARKGQEKLSHLKQQESWELGGIGKCLLRTFGLKDDKWHPEDDGTLRTIVFRPIIIRETIIRQIKKFL